MEVIMPGLSRRIAYAFRCFVAIVVKGQIPVDIVQALVKSPTDTAQIPAPAPAPSAMSPAKTADRPTDADDRAVQLLALLQRDGRLIDFCSENIADYSDAQIGAAVRELHQNCRQVLERYVKLEPILDSAEGQPVTVQAGFDAATIKVIGNIAGRPPLRGMLRHRGWRVTRLQLPPLPESASRSIIAPAEVEIE
jgi:uncharacterized protein DUF2760